MRRMFAIINDNVEYAPEEATYSHKEWFTKEGWDINFNETIRGYADETGVYFYAGDDFHATPHMVKAFMDYLDNIAQHLNIDGDQHVFAGLVVTKDVSAYPPDKDLGKLKHLREIRTTH